MGENQIQPPPKPGEQPPPPKPSDQEKTPIRSDAKFWVAIALIVGMLIVLIIAAAQEQYTQTTQLSAIFSGWITSIVAFYFYTQTHGKLQDQVKASAQAEAAAHLKADANLERAHASEKRVSKTLGYIKGLEAKREKGLAEADIEKIKAMLQEET